MNNKVKHINTIVLSITFVLVFCMSIGYSALSVSLNFGGTAAIAEAPMIVLTGVEKKSVIGGALETFNPSHSSLSANFGIELPSLSSTITYSLIFTNYSATKDYELKTFIENAVSNTNMTYEVSGFRVGYIAEKADYSTMKITFKYRESVTTLPADTTGNFSYEFFFEEFTGISSKETYVNRGLVLNLRGYDEKVNGNWVDTLGNVFTLNGNCDRNEIFNFYSFDGNGDFAKGAQAFIPSTGDFTLEVYIKTPSVLLSSSDQSIISQINDSVKSTGRFKINYRQDGDYPLPSLIEWNNYNGPLSNLFISDIEPSKDYQLQLVRDGNQLKFYVNGNITNTVSFPTTQEIANEPLKLGKFYNADPQYYSGFIYAVRVYDEVLSDTELVANYQSDLKNYKIAGEEILTNVKDYALAFGYTTSGDGLYTDQNESGRYIYKGLDPANYVTLNGETYRILSFETNDTMRLINVSTKLKGDTITDTIEFDYDQTSSGLFRDPSVNTFCFNAQTKGCNAWTTYDSLTAYDSSEKVTYTGTVVDESSLNTYLNTTYLNSLPTSLQNNLINGTYNVGGMYSGSNFSTMLAAASEKQWSGKIALPTAVMVHEASLTSGTLGASISANFITSLVTSTQQIWTMTQSLKNNWDVWLIIGSLLSERRASRADYSPKYYYAYPVITISSNLNITGTGIQSDPFTINF